jgi:hypothetical protein
MKVLRCSQIPPECSNRFQGNQRLHPIKNLAFYPPFSTVGSFPTMVFQHLKEVKVAR